VRPLLLCAAYPPELRAIPESLAGARGVALGVVGIGAVAAAVGATRLVAEIRPRAVLLLGTAGAYPGSGLPVGSAVVVSEAVAIPAIPRGVAHVADRRMAGALRTAGARSVRAGTTLGVTADRRLARVYGRLARVEHLEVYGVAEACRAAGVAFGALLGISNAVGPRGHAEWKRNEPRALDAIARVLERARPALVSPRTRA